MVEEKLRPEALASGLGLTTVIWRTCRLLGSRIAPTSRVTATSIGSWRPQSRRTRYPRPFDLPLALIVIDTLSATGNFRDANDAAEGQRIMNRLAELSRQTGAFVLAVDHFGKAVETGTRGSSAEEAAADVVLALLADREINGAISNTRMALRKLRGGKVGAETPFNLRVVDLGSETTCVVEWRTDTASPQDDAAARQRWPRSLRTSRRQWKPPSPATACRYGPMAAKTPARRRSNGRPWPSTPFALNSWRPTRQREATPRPSGRPN